MSEIFLSVIIPCYNEKENLHRGVLDEVYKFLKTQNYSWEVLISDDGSTDESSELVKKIISGKKGMKLVENVHGGKPSALWGGIKEAKGKWILFSDMDQSTPISEFQKLISYFDKYDIVIGSRGMTRENFAFYRKLGSVFFRIFRQSILLPDINDTQCGFKAFKSEVVKKIFPKLQFFQKKETVKGWKVSSFDVELLFLAEKMDFKIKEVPVEWKDRDISKGKQRSYLNESIEMLKQIMRVKYNDIRGLYQ